MNLYEKIIAIYPELKIDVNNINPNNPMLNGQIVLQNDNDGNDEYIAKWEYPALSKPTDEELENN